MMGTDALTFADNWHPLARLLAYTLFIVVLIIPALVIIILDKFSEAILYAEAKDAVKREEVADMKLQMREQIRWDREHARR